MIPTDMLGMPASSGSPVGRNAITADRRTAMVAAPAPCGQALNTVMHSRSTSDPRHRTRLSGPLHPLGSLSIDARIDGHAGDQRVGATLAGEHAAPQLL